MDPKTDKKRAVIITSCQVIGKNAVLKIKITV
jgi:hypothetical protein